MLTAIKLRRRTFLGAAVALSVPGGCATPQRPSWLAASWQLSQTPPRYQVGILVPTPEGRLRVHSACEVPSRAHGLAWESGGTLLAVARRPGSWLLRWNLQGQALAWAWNATGSTLNGHVLVAPDGNHLYTTETDTETGAGLVGVRDARSLQLQTHWPTEGHDPHQLVWMPAGLPPAGLPPAGQLLITNGGLRTLPETGRVKHQREAMDASLVALEAVQGRCRGQWRLEDRYLSLRHLAWGQSADLQPLLGIALQAEHADLQDRAAAPVLALFDGQHLSVPPKLPSGAGYGGDITAQGSRFTVSCPRQHGLLTFDARTGHSAWRNLHEACALTATPAALWAGGQPQVLAETQALYRLPEGLRLDNHWLALPPAAFTHTS